MTELEKQLIEDEGLRLKPYRCPAGKWTIGVGRNIEDNGITEDEALYLLRNDISRCERELARFPWFQALDAVRRGVVINMCFNLGLPRLSKFRNMLAAIAAGNYDLAADEMINSLWARQVGKRAQRLTRQMRTGVA